VNFKKAQPPGILEKIWVNPLRLGFSTASTYDYKMTLKIDKVLKLICEIKTNKKQKKTWEGARLGPVIRSKSNFATSKRLFGYVEKAVCADDQKYQ